VQVGTEPQRAVFRLIDRTHDRVDQALATVNLLRRADPAEKPAASTLSRLTNLVRADVLVLLSLKGDRARIWYFDAEKGALSNEALESTVDASGRVAALTAKVAALTPAPPAPASAPTASGEGTSTAAPKKLNLNAPPPEPQITETAPPSVTYPRHRKPTPWWSWLIAGAIGAGLLAYIYSDRPQKQGTLGVHASWVPPDQIQ
jgi:hypothetical protein